MRRIPRLWLRSALVVVMVLQASGLWAQPPRALRNRRPGAQFHLPQPGSRLPDLTVYDQEGKPLALKSLRGSWTVLVFGCLT